MLLEPFLWHVNGVVFETWLAVIQVTLGTGSDYKEKWGANN
jgi:hypothetical protein